MSSNGALVVCQSGFEGLLVREMEGLGLPAAETGPGWALSAGPEGRIPALRAAAFPHAILESPTGISGERVNGLAQDVLDLFAHSLRGERGDAPLPGLFAGE
jgi:hypothetical protein